MAGYALSVDGGVVEVSLDEELRRKGVILMSLSTAAREHPDLVIDIRATPGRGRTDYDELPGSLQLPLDGTRIFCPCEIVLITEDFEIALGNVEVARWLVALERLFEAYGERFVGTGVANKCVVSSVELARRRVHPFTPSELYAATLPFGT